MLTELAEKDKIPGIQMPPCIAPGVAVNRLIKK